MDNEKQSKFEFLHQRTSDVDDRLNELSDQTQKKFSVVKENVRNYLLFNLDRQNPKAN